MMNNINYYIGKLVYVKSDKTYVKSNKYSLLYSYNDDKSLVNIDQFNVVNIFDGDVDTEISIVDRNLVVCGVCDLARLYTVDLCQVFRHNFLPKPTVFKFISISF